MADKTFSGPHGYPWAFPEHKAVRNAYGDSHAWTTGQLVKLMEEAGECWEAHASDDVQHLAFELMNVIHVCETTLRGIPCHDIDSIRAEVVTSNYDRGYYGEEPWE